VVVAPIVLVVVELIRWKADAVPAEARWWLIAIGVVAGVAAWPVVVSTRSKGWDTDLLLTIVGQTDDNLVEAIGRLGWLDAPIPAFAVYAWLLAIGGAVAYALVGNVRGLLAAGVLVSVAALSSWTFELLQDNDSGTYWQGRYSLPLLIGLPLLLVTRPAGRTEQGDQRASADSMVRRLDARLAVWLTITGLVVLNLGAWAAARRWGVGLDGTYLPWRWDTSLQPLPSVLPLALLAVCSAGLGRAVVGSSERGRHAPAVA
jgi:CDP-diglyceride synthetase